jgi:hypothetical protein
MTVKVPFSFSVQGRSLPSGEYTIFTVLPERMIRITSCDGRYSALVNTLPNYASSPSENSRLIFQRYGNDYFLAQVWTLGQTVGRNPMLSQRAMERARSGSPLQNLDCTGRSQPPLVKSYDLWSMGATPRRPFFTIKEFSTIMVRKARGC